MTRSQSGRFISTGREIHHCDMPGWRERRRADVTYGAVWECECGERYRYDYTYAGDVWWPVKGGPARN